MRIQDIITETTSSGAIASIAGTLGDQTERHRSIYSDKKKPKKKKSTLIRRVNTQGTTK